MQKGIAHANEHRALSELFAVLLVLLSFGFWKISERSKRFDFIVQLSLKFGSQLCLYGNSPKNKKEKLEVLNEKIRR